VACDEFNSFALVLILDWMIGWNWLVRDKGGWKKWVMRSPGERKDWEKTVSNTVESWLNEVVFLPQIATDCPLRERERERERGWCQNVKRNHLALWLWCNSPKQTKSLISSPTGPNHYSAHACVREMSFAPSLLKHWDQHTFLPRAMWEAAWELKLTPLPSLSNGMAWHHTISRASVLSLLS